PRRRAAPCTGPLFAQLASRLGHDHARQPGLVDLLERASRLPTAGRPAAQRLPVWVVREFAAKPLRESVAELFDQQTNLAGRRRALCAAQGVHLLPERLGPGPPGRPRVAQLELA